MKLRIQAVVLAVFLGGLLMAEGYKTHISMVDDQHISVNGQTVDAADAFQLHRDLTDILYGKVVAKPCGKGEQLFYVSHPRTSQVVPVCAKDSLWAATQGITVWPEKDYLAMESKLKHIGE